MQKVTHQLSFSSISIAKRKLKSQFFDQMSLLLDWPAIDSEIKKYYSKVAGRPSYSVCYCLKYLFYKHGMV